MTHKKTDNEIIKALECCAQSAFDENVCEKECPYKGNCWDEQNGVDFHKDVLDLINRKKADYEYQTERLSHYMKMLDSSIEERNKLRAEVECLKADISCLERCMRTANIEIAKTKAEAIKEFTNEFEKRCIVGGIYPAFVKRQLENTKKEIMEDNYVKKVDWNN